MNDLVLVTGTWSTGKTTLLEALAGEYVIVPEVGRRIAIKTDGESSPQYFATTFLARSIDNWSTYEQAGTTTLFDRGIPDALAYARFFGLDTTDAAGAVLSRRYRDTVLFCPFEESIYETDDQRRATPEMALDFEVVLIETYEEADYTLRPIPLVDVPERAELVRLVT